MRYSNASGKNSPYIIRSGYSRDWIVANYHEYLRSDHWKRVRAIYKKHFSWKCYICKSSYRLELHHRQYNRVGSERPFDLVPLCRQHHEEAHRLAKSMAKRKDKHWVKVIYAATKQLRKWYRRDFKRYTGAGGKDKFELFSRRLSRRVARHEKTTERLLEKKKPPPRTGFDPLSTPKGYIPPQRDEQQKRIHTEFCRVLSNLEEAQ